MADRRLLLLSYCFPPTTAPEAMLSAKRLGNLPGWQVDVVCAAPFHPGLGNDPEMGAYAQARFGAIRRVSPTFPRFPYRRLGPIARLPDEFRFLNGKVAAAARSLGLDRYDAIMSWSQYHSVHLAAAQLKSERPGLKWLAHFSDPWTDNAFLTPGKFEAAVNRRLERHVMALADRLLFTTPETVELVMGKYPGAWREKAVIIPHGYDPALYPGLHPEPAEGRPLIARYLGNFYGRRSPEPLFAALGAALARDPTLPERLQIEIVGRLDAGMGETEMAKALPPGMVRLAPSVSYAQSLGMMETADLLLIVDAPGEISVFLPSKLVDYIGAGRPICALTPPGAAARVTLEAGGWVADPADSEAGASALLAALDHATKSNVTAKPHGSAYSVGATGESLAAVLASLTGSGPGQCVE